jgi:hypothetical protein
MSDPLFHNFMSSVLLLLMLLNPFLLIIYLIDLIQELDDHAFSQVMLRAGLISTAVFIVVALVGDALFTHVLQVRFASFQIFGGIIFLLIGIQFMFTGPEAIRKMRGKPEHIAGAIAMPSFLRFSQRPLCSLVSKANGRETKLQGLFSRRARREHREKQRPFVSHSAAEPSSPSMPAEIVSPRISILSIWYIRPGRS